MQAKDIKNYLNNTVIYTGENPYLKGCEFILTGAIFRKNDKGFYYQAELQDKCKNSVCMVKIEDVEGEDE